MFIKGICYWLIMKNVYEPSRAMARAITKEQDLVSLLRPVAMAEATLMTALSGPFGKLAYDALDSTKELAYSTLSAMTFAAGIGLLYALYKEGQKEQAQLYE